MWTLRSCFTSVKGLLRQMRVYNSSNLLLQTCTRRCKPLERRVGSQYLSGITEDSLTEFIVGMAATMERLEEYKAYNSSFTTRLTQFLSVLFSAQVTRLFLHK